MQRREALCIRALLLLAGLALGLGLTAPCLTIQPQVQGYDGWIALLDPSFHNPTAYSILSGILAMMADNLPLGLLLIAFSVVFPTLKLATMAGAVEALRRRQAPHWLNQLTHHIGKFSMLDVMVVALVILAIKGMPGDSEVTLGWGLYAFAASVLLSLAAGAWMHRVEHRLHAPRPATPPAPE